MTNEANPQSCPAARELVSLLAGCETELAAALGPERTAHLHRLVQLSDPEEFASSLDELASNVVRSPSRNQVLLALSDPTSDRVDDVLRIIEREAGLGGMLCDAALAPCSTESPPKPGRLRQALGLARTVAAASAATSAACLLMAPLVPIAAFLEHRIRNLPPAEVAELAERVVRVLHTIEREISRAVHATNGDNGRHGAREPEDDAPKATPVPGPAVRLCDEAPPPPGG